MVFSYNIRNISWKFEEHCFENEGGNRFLVIFQNFWENWPKKFAVVLFVSITFHKNLNNFFEFYKNWLVVFTYSLLISKNKFS